MDWFERLMGFREDGYAQTKSRLAIEGNRLRSLVNGKSYGIGELELVSLEALRDRAKRSGNLPGKLKVSVVTGDVRQLHSLPEYAGALFQVASQFNLLEMVGPSVTPEQGVTRYEQDRTQGPACAVAAGAATVYRNYYAPIGGLYGQTTAHQLDGLADVGAALSEALAQPVDALWRMQNGYALCTQEGLKAITGYLARLEPKQYDALRGKLRIGVHRDVEVTDVDGLDGHLVSQAFCSALPVRYVGGKSASWRAFASFVLKAAYEATIWTAVSNAQRGVSNVVLLTRLGGGAFGNDHEWIDAAMLSALRIVRNFNLDVRLVSYGPPSQSLLGLEKAF